MFPTKYKLFRNSMMPCFGVKSVFDRFVTLKKILSAPKATGDPLKIRHYLGAGASSVWFIVEFCLFAKSKNPKIKPFCDRLIIL